jgi:hypothetical protein
MSSVKKIIWPLWISVVKFDEISYSDKVSEIRKTSRKYQNSDKTKSLQEKMEVLNKLIVIFELIIVRVSIERGHYDCVSNAMF